MLIEKGRHLKIPRENRLCSSCNTVEDETHFMLYCQKNRDIRLEFISKLNTSFNNLSDTEKMKFMLCPSTPKQVENIGSYIKRSLELRTGDS